MTATTVPAPARHVRHAKTLIVGAAVTATVAAAGITAAVSSQNTDTPAAATRRYLAALTDGPGTRICRTLTPRAQTQLLALLQQNGITPDCHNAGAVRDLLDPRQITAIRRAVHDGRITTVVHGNTATARLETIEDGLTPQTMPLVRKNGRWLIDGGIG